MQRSVPETGSWCLQLELNSRKREKTDLEEVFYCCSKTVFNNASVVSKSVSVRSTLEQISSWWCQCHQDHSLFGHFEMSLLYKGLNKNKSKGHLVESRYWTGAVRILKYSVKLCLSKI